MSTPLSYPFDPTGSLASNLISNEQQVITAVNYSDYHFIVPFLAPYFLDSMTITQTSSTGVVTPLTMGIDWYGCFEFISASRACAAPIWGGVSFLNTQLSGVITMTYQTLGGTYTIDMQQISELLAYNLQDPRVTAWEEVVNQPSNFPPIDHEWDLVDMVGLSELVAELTNIENAIRDANGASLEAHITNYNNPHQTTAAQVNLGLVQNYGIATPADVTAGTSNTLYMTPALTYMMVYGAAGPGAALQAHITDYDNPHQTTAAQSGAYSTTQIDSMLQGYLSSTDTAANSLELAGLNVTALTQQILAGTAANSVLFDGLNQADFTAQVLGGTANNASQFGGQTPAAYMASVLAGTAANASAFGGLDPTDYAASVLTGTSAGTNTFNGMTPTDYAAWVLANGTASNSAEFGGQTPTQFIAFVKTSLGVGTNLSVNAYPATTGDTAATYWLELARMIVPSDSEPADTFTDAHWMLSGGDSNGEQFSGLYYIHLSNKGTSPNNAQLDVIELSSWSTTAQFGYTIENVDPGTGTPVPTIRVWMETGPNMGAVLLTSLSQDSASYISTTINRVDTAPNAGDITYPTPDSFALASQLSSAVTTITSVFETMTGNISS